MYLIIIILRKELVPTRRHDFTVY